MTEVFDAAFLARAISLCALLASACGDDVNPKGPRSQSQDPAEGEGDAGSPDAGARPAAPADDASHGGEPLDSGDVEDPGDGDDDLPLPPDAGEPEGTPGTLLDLPHDGQRLSICYADADCEGDDVGCYATFGTAPGFCTSRCESDADCAPIEGLEASCSPDGLCRVDCSGKGEAGDGACPADMECRDLFDPSLVASGEVSEPGLITIWRCAYPVHGGTNQVELYQRCDLEHGSGDCAGELLCHAPSSALGRPSNPGYCAQACEGESECPVPGGTTSVPFCADGICELDCSAGGATCPSGMNCRQVGGPASEVYRCRYIAE